MEKPTEHIDYNQSVLVKSNKESVFKALTEDIDKWWSSVENSAGKVNDVFKVSFSEESYWKFKVLEYIKHEKIVWECIESNQDHNLKGIDEEWLNSKLFWSISDNDGGVTVHFLHKGLVSTGVCYDVCSAAWDFYILNSLKNYLEKGIGKAGKK